MQWAYRTASVSAHVLEGIAVWSVTGEVTADIWPAILFDAAVWHERVRALASIADYRCGTVSMDLASYILAASDVVVPRTAIAVPMVIVPEQRAFFRDYSDAMCSRGVHRAVVNDLDAAQLWARRMADFRYRVGFAEASKSRR
jgi:hypothetical protein